jgi:hypothetical protein
MSAGQRERESEEQESLQSEKMRKKGRKKRSLKFEVISPLCGFIFGKLRDDLILNDIDFTFFEC